MSTSYSAEASLLKSSLAHHLTWVAYLGPLFATRSLMARDCPMLIPVPLVLSKAIWERLQVCPETLEVLVNKGIAVEVLQTETAVERFNELRESVPVGGLFHSTC
jgi:hypothetical protein